MRLCSRARTCVGKESESSPAPRGSAAAPYARINGPPSGYEHLIMMNEVEGLIQRVTTGDVDESSVSQSASDHVSSMDQEQLTQHLQTAAGNANQQGEGDIAQQLLGLVGQHGGDPQALKDRVASLISSNPQILRHFEPAFAKDILGNV